jgi:hypothetical protein
MTTAANDDLSDNALETVVNRNGPCHTDEFLDEVSNDTQAYWKCARGSE